MSRNAVRLNAVLTTVEPLRHTPAGLPVVDFILQHQSKQMEAGHQRQVEFGITAKAVGDIAVKIAGIRQGSTVEAKGFLDRKNRMSRQMVLHVTDIELI